MLDPFVFVVIVVGAGVVGVILGRLLAAGELKRQIRQAYQMHEIEAHDLVMRTEQARQSERDCWQIADGYAQENRALREYQRGVEEAL